MSEEKFKFAKPGTIRVRIAPSPTGFLHIGTARAALFNYLFARNNQGTFILRIEDTDVERSSIEFEKDVIDSLKWLGINWDEGPEIGGDYGPYKQSEKIANYRKYLEQLLGENKAYYCFCSTEELETQRQYQMSQGETPRYTGKCANLPKETVEKYLSEGRPSIIRFRTDAKKLPFHDLIRGKVEFDTELMGDTVIAKNLDSPLYNFAVVIDDFEMKISHVIRGEDHISNTPKQILIQEALGFPKLEYAHLPMVLAQDKTKLSKRHGATAVTEYRALGYLPEAIINFLAFLGWNPGDEREIYSLPSLVKEFSLEKVQKSGAVFNIKKLDFLNGFYIRQKTLEKITELCLPYLIDAELIEKDGVKREKKAKHDEELKLFGKEKSEETYPYAVKKTGEGITLEKISKIISIYRERLKKLSEITELTEFFFTDKLDFDEGLLKWKEMQDKEIKESLSLSEKLLSKVKEKEWTKENLEKVLMPEAEKSGDRGGLLWPLRVALSGKQASAGPFEIAEILGKDDTIKRIKEAEKMLK